MSYQQQDVLRRFNLYISSSQRSEGTPSSFTIQLPNQLVLNNLVPSKFEVCIDRAQIPLSFSQFNDRAKSTQLQWSSGGYEGLAVIPFGNYDVKTLGLVVAQTVRSSVIAATNGAIQPVLSFSYNLEQNRYRIGLSGAASITFHTEEYSGLSKALGFADDWTLVQNQLVYSTQDVCVSPSRSLYITSQTLVQDESYEALTSPFRLTSVLACIPIVHSPLLFLTHQPPRPVITRLANSVINDIQLTLRDEQSDQLYEFDLDWSCHISIAEIRVDPLVDAGRMDAFRLDNLEMYQKLRDTHEKQLLSMREQSAAVIDKLKQKVIDKLVKDQQRLEEKKHKTLSDTTSKRHARTKKTQAGEQPVQP